MYLQHFQLKEFPFGITPDTSYFFSSNTSQQALNTLLVATRSGEGFIKISGEVGTGKTMLCRQLLQAVGDEFQTAYIPNPVLSPQGLLLELASELNVDLTALNTAPAMQHQHIVVSELNKRLLELAMQGKRVLVCLDEAQAMPLETLEALRLLTNLETQKRKLLQVVIFGQPELDEKLNHPSIRQLKQRITFDDKLGPLSAAELGRYLNHRMTVAGYEGANVFTSLAVTLMRWGTKGYPRLVNIVAHKALMCAYGRGHRRVGWREMLDALNDTSSVQLVTRKGMFVAASAVVLTLGLVIALSRTLHL